MKLRKNGAHPAVKSDMRFWILCVCFLLGMAAAYPARRSISADALAQLGAYVQSYARLADGRSQQPVSVLSAAAAYLRYPLLAFLFGLSAAGVALIPLLCAAQGFFLSFSVCCFAAALGRDGVLLALDFMRFSQSRLATIDIYGTFFILQYRTVLIRCLDLVFLQSKPL